MESFKALKQHYQASLETTHLRKLISDNDRNKQLNLYKNGILVNTSHSKWDISTLKLLSQHYKAAKIDLKIKAMYDGQLINKTQQREVLHIATRASQSKVIKDSKQNNVVSQVHQVLKNIKAFSDQVRSGKILGYSGKIINSIVCIGIGGSYLAVDFIYQALRSHPDCINAARIFNQETKQASALSSRTLKFIANVDPFDALQNFDALNHETTLFIVISKTFTTRETILNAKTARNWLIEKYTASQDTFDPQSIVSSHMCAVSTNLKGTKEFGILDSRVFKFWDWVGGRFSVCCAVGALPLSLVFGFDIFKKFLSGAQSMDDHFIEETDPLKNQPILLGLLAFWNSQVLNYTSLAILPYAQCLKRFVQHIQQLSMQSNGKRVKIDGQVLQRPAGPIIFGEPGTNGQHSFYQHLHQGQLIIPTQFIGFSKPQRHYTVPGEAIPNHDQLMSNFFAQPDALALGKTEQEIDKSKLKSKDHIPHMLFAGDRPSVSILFDNNLNPYTCGQLLALYEHRVAVEGFLYSVNSFDQMGVELGKKLAVGVSEGFGEVRASVKSSKEMTEKFNSGTGDLIVHYLRNSN